MVQETGQTEAIGADQFTVRAEIQVLSAADPASAAEALAAEVGGLRVSSASDAEHAVAARAGDDHRVLREEDETDLRHLANRLIRAQRIRAQTHAAVTAAIADKVAKAAGLEVHPAALEAAAQAVADAEAALEALEAEQAELDRPLVEPAQPGAQPPSPVRKRGPARSVLLRVAALTLAVVALAGAAALRLADLPLAVPAAVAVLGVLAAVLLARSSRVRSSGEVEDALAAEASERLATLRVLDIKEEERRRTVRRTALGADFVRARQKLRLARRSWESLAGPDSDPHDLEGTLRAHDAQYDLVAATKSSPSVRAVDTLYRRAAARWRVAWAALGVDEAPAPEDVDAAVAALMSSKVETGGPLVFVEPAAWMPADRTRELLRRLPPETVAYIVNRA